MLSIKSFKQLYAFPDSNDSLAISIPSFIELSFLHNKLLSLNWQEQRQSALEFHYFLKYLKRFFEDSLIFLPPLSLAESIILKPKSLGSSIKS